MYLPNWQGVSPEVTDLLIGHEDGHALFTPEEGWHNASSSRGGNFKGFLNVCEDARIEKKIKRKYPGLRKSFLKGYKELFDRDFFGVQNRSIDSLLLIDRINLQCKIGAHLDIPFTSEERELLNEVLETETWEQVVAVAEKLFDYCKQEQKEKESNPMNEPEDDSEEDESFGSDGAEQDSDEDDSEESDEESSSDTESEESEESDEDGEADSEKKKSSSNDTNSEQDDDLSDENDNGDAEDDNSGDEPQSLTDKVFRENLRELVKQKRKVSEARSTPTTSTSTTTATSSTTSTVPTTSTIQTETSSMSTSNKAHVS